MDENEEIPESEERKIPKFLHITFWILVIWGIGAFIMYWNGSQGFLDRGYWRKLQQAANTTFPFEEEKPYLMEKNVLKEEKINHFGK